MTVESTTTIDGLDPTLPLTTDRLIEGDNHLRLLKIVVKNIFPGANGDGFNIPIIATEAQLNYLQGLTADIEAQLIDLRNGEVPVGGIQNYIGLISAIPSRFFLCDGNNGTPDLANKFIIGTATEGALGVTGGSADDIVVSHTHTANHDHTGSSDILGEHLHTMPPRGTDVGSFTSPAGAPRSTSSPATILPSGDHTHSASMPVENIDTENAGVSAVGTNIPVYYKAAYIMRVS